MATATDKSVSSNLSEKSGEFGMRLAELRGRAQLTVYALSKRSGVSQQAIARIEKGRGDPNWTTVVALAQALGVSLAEFDVTLRPDADAAGEGEEGDEDDLPQ